MSVWIIVGIILAMIIALIFVWFIWLIYTKRRAQNRVVVSALIDIYASGSHHIEFIPAAGVHPVDMVQLVISYIANVIFVTETDHPKTRQGLSQLYDFIGNHLDNFDDDQYRQNLNDLVGVPAESLLSSGKLAAGRSERYEVRLIRGKNFDYSLSEFSPYGYKPNLTKSALFLYNAVAHKLNPSYLYLLHTSLMGLFIYFREHKINANNNQTGAFEAVIYFLSISPKPLENSPGRLHRKL